MRLMSFIKITIQVYTVSKINKNYNYITNKSKEKKKKKITKPKRGAFSGY